MPRPPRTVAELVAAGREGRQVNYLFFFSPQPQRDGGIGPGCLSQWWPAPIVIDGHTFATNEHYMMWRKATLFGDEVTAAQIMATPHPHAAKELGRQVTGFDEQVWRLHRYDVVVTGNLAKFGQYEPLRAFLLDTGERILAEASPTEEQGDDQVWSIGLPPDHTDAAEPSLWPGLSLLGFALMDVRDQLRDPGRQ